MNGVFYHSSIDLKQGTFLLGGDNLIDGGPSTPANLTFSGIGTGTFSTDGYDATFNGSMTLSADGTIDFGSNGGAGGGTVLQFEDGGSRTAGTLTIDNWEGDIWSGGGTDQIIFGTTLSDTFLANVLWSDITPAFQLGARQLPSGEILPLIPEPSTFAGIGFLIGFIFWRERKRRMAGNLNLS